MNPFNKFEKILVGQCKIKDPLDWEESVEEHKLLQLAQHMRDSRETDPFILSIALSYLCAHTNGAEAAKLMLQTTPVDVNRSCLSYIEHTIFYNGIRLMPPLHMAVDNDGVDVVRLLLQQTNELQRKNGKKRLKRQKIDVNIKSGIDSDCSPLLQATQKATTTRHATTQLEIIELLLQHQGIDISAKLTVTALRRSQLHASMAILPLFACYWSVIEVC